MSLTSTDEKANAMTLLQMTTDIVSSYCANNEVSTGDMATLIADVHKALQGIANGAQDSDKAERREPAIPVKKSVTPDYIICLEDGKKLKMLKRYLRTTYNMSPEEYRAKWNLPPDYPMVAPNYSERRSDFAKKIGLGRKSDKV